MPDRATASAMRAFRATPGDEAVRATALAAARREQAPAVVFAQLGAWGDLESMGPMGWAQALLAFVAGCNAVKLADYERTDYPENLRETLRLEDSPRRRYAKLVVVSPRGTDRSVYCFVDKRGGKIDGIEHRRGDVLKSASWSKPAKHARGNIFDEHNGLANMTPFGAAYIR